MRRTLIAVLFLVLVINYVDRASCQTNTTNTTTTNTTTNSTTNTTTNTTTTNTTNNPSVTVNNITFFQANGSAITVNTYTAKTVAAGKGAYFYLDKLAAGASATVYVLPTEVTSVYSSGFPLKLSVIIQPTAASSTASLVATKTYDGNALMVPATASVESYLMAQIDNPDTKDYAVVVNFNTNTYTNLLSPMGTVTKKRTGVTTSSFQNPGYWDQYDLYVPSANVKVLIRLFSCVGASQMYYVTTSTDAANVNKTVALQASSIIPNNTLEVTFTAVGTAYILVNPYAGTTQSDGTLSTSYTLDVSMYNSTTTVPFSNYVPGGNGYISYTRNSDQSVQFSWNGVASASTDYPITAATVSYSVYVATSQDAFTTLLNCGPAGAASADGVNTFIYNSTTTSQAVPLNPSNLYYVGVVGSVTNYAFSAYQGNIPALYAIYAPTSYNYVKPSSSESNPAGLGVTVFFLVLLIIIVIILAIVLYTKYKNKKNAEMGGASMGNRAAATTTAAAATSSSKAGAKATSPPQSAMPVLPKNQPEPPKKPETKYAPPPVPEPTPAIRVDQLRDDHGLQQVDHHYEVEQQVPDNYDYNPGQGEYQGEEYQGGNQDDYNPDAYAAPEQEHHGQEYGQEQNQEYEVPADQHEVSPDNDHHHEH